MSVRACVHLVFISVCALSVCSMCVCVCVRRVCVFENSRIRERVREKESESKNEGMCLARLCTVARATYCRSAGEKPELVLVLLGIRGLLGL